MDQLYTSIGYKFDQEVKDRIDIVGRLEDVNSWKKFIFLEYVLRGWFTRQDHEQKKIEHMIMRTKRGALSYLPSVCLISLCMLG